MITSSGTTWQKVRKNADCYLMLLPFALLFITFVVLPVIGAVFISLTDYNMLEAPSFVGLDNYLRVFLEDNDFITAVRNTLVFAVVTGPLSYIACLLFAWLINELGRHARAVLTTIFYLPTMSASMYVIWTFIFSGDQYGLLNSMLMSMRLVDEPVQWLTDAATVLPVIMLVQLWMSLGTSFLSFIAGLQNVDRTLYEAAAVDGIRNRWQELFFVTLPSMGPQLLFGAVMQISASFSVSQICITLAGFPSTDNAALTIVTHIMDYGNMRMELGYASALSVVLFAFVLLVNNLVQKVIHKYADT